jgi:transcription elongation factor Elf1
MATAQQSRFRCPTCGSLYEIVRVEAESVTVDRELSCLMCGAPLQGREGRYVLKYFLVELPRNPATRRKRRA